MNPTMFLHKELTARGVDVSQVSYKVNRGRDGESVVAAVKGRVIGIHAGDTMILDVPRRLVARKEA